MPPVIITMSGRICQVSADTLFRLRASSRLPAAALYSISLSLSPRSLSAVFSTILPFPSFLFRLLLSLFDIAADDEMFGDWLLQEKLVESLFTGDTASILYWSQRLTDVSLDKSIIYQVEDGLEVIFDALQASSLPALTPFWRYSKEPLFSSRDEAAVPHYLDVTEHGDAWLGWYDFLLAAS